MNIFRDAYPRSGTMRFFKTIPVVVALLIVGCGGGGGGGSDRPPVTPQPPAQESNVTDIKVGQGPYGILNLPMVSVTVCAPGDASRCYVIDNVLLDTGSIGLRVVGSALASVAPNLVLPVENDALGRPLYECVGFIDGSYAWGGVRRADVKIGGKVAANIPLQLIGDIPASGVRPPHCTSVDPSLDLGTAANMGANAILGVNYWVEDCGSFCEDSAGVTLADAYYYFTCNNNSCAPASVPLASQVKNPVAAFVGDNNGVIVDLPPLSAQGSASVSGSLIFGINTRSNNSLGSAHLFDGYYLTTLYKGTLYPAFIDSGSNALYFDDLTIPRCNSSIFFCPAAQLDLSAVVGDQVSTDTRTVGFSVANTRNLPNGNYAFNNLAGLFSFTDQTAGHEVFDWGLPFFFGRKVYFGMEGGTYPRAVGF
jgi:hypothetical protein